MTDIHAHILPGLDDGAQRLSDSLAMAELALESGVDTVIATPHCGVPDGDGVSSAQEMRTALDEFRAALAAREIPLRVYGGMEIFGTPSTAEKLKSGLLATLAESRYPLIEFPFERFGMEATQILRAVAESGLRPIVAHPERYRYVQREPQILNLWTDMGCLMQINRGSLFGRFGAQTQALAEGMLERGFASFIASDAHSPSQRTTWMRDVREYLEKGYDVRLSRLLLEINPGRVLADLPIEPDEPMWF